jgi:putative FmdB family regulatory protein
MPIYEFKCPICPQHSEEFFGMNDVKAIKCLNCGSQMDRMWTAPALTGDALMTRRWNYYDVGLGCAVTSKADRDRKMQERGLQEAETTPTMDPFYKEIGNIQKRTRNGDRNATAAINAIAKEAGRVRSDEIVKRELEPAFARMDREAQGYDGRIDD